MVLNSRRLRARRWRELAAEYGWPNEAEAIARGAAAHECGFYTLGDLVWLEAWKAGGGRRRSTQDNDEEYVRFLSHRALAVPVEAEGEVKERLRTEQLTLLKGVKYRMASVLLHFGRPFAPPGAGYPMMDRFSVEAAGLGTLTGGNSFESYELWWNYVCRCRALGARTELDLRVIDRALFIAGKRS